jgi:hypothetical protein
MANLRIYEHIRYENNDFMSQICEKNNSKVRFVESSFGQCIEIETTCRVFEININLRKCT